MNIFKNFGQLFRSSGMTPQQTSLLSRYVASWDQTDVFSNAPVSVRGGLHNDTVYTAVVKIASTVAMTPLPAFQYTSDGRGRDKMRQHPVFKVLNVKANIDHTAYTWKHITATHLLAWGNSFSFIERNNKGEVIALNPMRPEDTKIAGRTSDGQLLYSWTNGTNQSYLFPASDILHIKGTTFDGVVGISPIVQLRQLVGRSESRNEYQSRFYANGAMLGGILQVPDGLTDEQLERHRKSFQQVYSGARNSGKILLLEGTSNFQPLGVHPRDAEFLATAKLDNAKIAAVFGIPMQFLNEVETTTRASAEELFKQFLSLGLNTVFNNIESEINVSLFNQVEQATMYTEFNRESLIQADYDALITGLKDQILTGICTPNEARSKLNMNPLPGGDSLLLPVNMVPAESLGKPQPGEQPITTPQTDKAAPSNKTNSLTVEQVFRAIEEAPTESKRSAKTSGPKRAGIVKAAKPMLRDAFQRIVTRETKDVANAVKKHLRSGKSMRAEGDPFERFLNDYYAKDSSFSDYFNKTVEPLIESITHSVTDSVSKQVGDFDADPSDFQDDYQSNLLWRHTNSSKNQLKALLSDLPDGEDGADTIDERLDQWNNGSTADNPTRAQKAGDDESVRMTNAVARYLFSAAGVTSLVWSGGDCPICQDLDGKTVGIDDSFANEGDELSNGFKVQGSVLNPPLHQGCNCEVNPEQ